MVFIGPFEHHSNELPWRESIADVVMIPESPDGHIDAERLEAELVRYADRPLKIGSFSAASNVTGILSDAEGITRLLHAHGALAFWDYAAGGPYIDIDMNPGGDPLQPRTRCSSHRTSSSAVPGTPGLLIVRRDLLTNRVPDVVGGGTVAYVSPTEHTYLTDPEHREEGGTPGDHRVDPRRPGVRPQARRRHRRDPGPRGGPRPPRRHRVVGQPGDRRAGQRRGRSAVHRLVHRARAQRALPAPQRDRRDAQRRVRHPGPRRLLLRRAVRAPAAGDLPGPLRGVRGADLDRLRGDQAGVGPGQLQLLHLRGRCSPTSWRRST